MVAWFKHHPIISGMIAGAAAAAIDAGLQLAETGPGLPLGNIAGTAGGIAWLVLLMLGPREGGRIDRFLKGMGLPPQSGSLERRYTARFIAFEAGLFLTWVGWGIHFFLRNQASKVAAIVMVSFGLSSVLVTLASMAMTRSALNRSTTDEG